jgi:hypothetical protein
VEKLVTNIRKRYLEVFSSHLGSAGSTPMYTADLVMFGISDRQIGLIESMPAIFESKNLHALAPLLRVQLDSLLRLHAFRIVEDSQDLAHHIIKGKSLRKYKDRNGKYLFDKHLVNTLKTELPWVESMYENLSGWVHFSESHIFSAVSEGQEENEIKVGIGGFRKDIPEGLFTEVRAALIEIHANTANLIEAYFARTK